ncbi:hypothetical protein ACJX0J_007469, partial [Zea mays]
DDEVMIGEVLKKFDLSSSIDPKCHSQTQVVAEHISTRDLRFEGEPKSLELKKRKYVEASHTEEKDILKFQVMDFIASLDLLSFQFPAKQSFEGANEFIINDLDKKFAEASLAEARISEQSKKVEEFATTPLAWGAAALTATIDIATLVSGVGVFGPLAQGLPIIFFIEKEKSCYK